MVTVGEAREILLVDAAGEISGCARETWDRFLKVVTVDADAGIGGRVTSSRFAREGTRGMLGADAVARVESVNDGREGLMDVRVGDIGRGGTSSVGEVRGRGMEKDARERENEARRDAREDFLLKPLVCLFFSLTSSLPESFPESYSYCSPPLVLTADGSLRPGESRLMKLAKRARCRGVFVSFCWDLLPLEGVRGLRKEPDLTCVAEGAREAVVAMDQRDTDWMSDVITRRCCNCVEPWPSSASARGEGLSGIRDAWERR